VFARCAHPDVPVESYLANSGDLRLAHPDQLGLCGPSACIAAAFRDVKAAQGATWSVALASLLAPCGFAVSIADRCFAAHSSLFWISAAEASVVAPLLALLAVGGAGPI